MEIRVDGLSSVQALLNKDLTRPISQAVTVVAAFMQNQAKVNLRQVIYSRSVPWRRTGKLQQSVTVDSVDNLSKRVFVGVDYGKFVEKGTRPHIIRPRRGKFLSFMNRDNKRIFAKEVHHPGTKPYPFFIPAVVKTRQEMPEIVMGYLKPYLK